MLALLVMAVALSMALPGQAAFDPKSVPKPNPKAKPTVKPFATSTPGLAEEMKHLGVPLKIGDRGQWKSAGGDKLAFRFQVVNQSWKDTIKAFEIYFYTTNVWGERIDSGVYTYTDSHEVAPGKTIYTDYVSLPNRSQICKVYAAIHRIIYTTGNVSENGDMTYSCWNVK